MTGSGRVSGEEVGCPHHARCDLPGSSRTTQPFGRYRSVAYIISWQFRLTEKFKTRPLSKLQAVRECRLPNGKQSRIGVIDDFGVTIDSHHLSAGRRVLSPLGVTELEHFPFRREVHPRAV